MNSKVSVIACLVFQKNDNNISHTYMHMCTTVHVLVQKANSKRYDSVLFLLLAIQFHD